MAAKNFDAATAHEEPEFDTFLKAAEKLIITKGQGISSAKSNDVEVTCKYSASISLRNLSCRMMFKTAFEF